MDITPHIRESRVVVDGYGDGSFRINGERREGGLIVLETEALSIPAVSMDDLTPAVLQPLVDRIATHVMASPKLHADDTPVPVLAPGTGKTATGRLWVYLRDNRRWRPSDKPAALFRYSPDRKGERPREHLKAFTGFLQADAYAGFERLYDPDRKPGPITPVACWAHARRKLHDVFQADPSSVAAEGLRKIRDLYEVERGIVQDPHDDRRKARKLSKLTALDFFAWADNVLGQVSARTPLAEALRYAVRLKPALLAYTGDGRIEIDNNLAENALRGIAVGRNYAKRRIMRRCRWRVQLSRQTCHQKLHIITGTAGSSSVCRWLGSGPARRCLTAASSEPAPSSRDQPRRTCASLPYLHDQATGR